MAHLVGGQVSCKERVVRDEKLGFKQMKESQWKWIARSRAKKTRFFLVLVPEKILAHSCAFLRQNLAFLRKNLAFLRVLARCFRLWNLKLCDVFLPDLLGTRKWVPKGGRTGFDGFSIAAEENQKYWFCLWTWSGKVSSKWGGRVAKKVNTWKGRLESKALWELKTKEILPKESLAPILIAKWLSCSTLHYWVSEHCPKWQCLSCCTITTLKMFTVFVFVEFNIAWPNSNSPILFCWIVWPSEDKQVCAWKPWGCFHISMRQSWQPLDCCNICISVYGIRWS